MTAFVVDVNVAVVANGGRTPHADLKCQSACIDALEGIKQRKMIVLDDEWLILSEYTRNLKRSGQLGAGDRFLIWVLKKQTDASRCEQVHLACRGNNPDDFAAFPSDPRLGSFHRDDRKYVAAALSSQHDPTVLNAVDTDWWKHRAALQESGVSILFLCPQHMK